MKNFLKRFVVTALAVAMVLTAIPTTVVRAEDGANKDGASIQLYDAGKESWKLIFNTWGEENDKVSGVTYDTKSNTLTLQKYVNADAGLYFFNMGDNFKIKVSGTDEVGNINLYGYTWGGSLEITGSGTLTVNKNRKADIAIEIYNKSIDSSLKVNEGVVLKAYSGTNSDAPTIQVQGKNQNSISIAGVSSSAYAVDGPWEQHDSVAAENLNTCMETTYKDGEEDENQYVAVSQDEDGGYYIFRKLEATVGEYPVYENCGFKSAEEMSGLVNENSTLEAFLLNYNYISVDFIEDAGDTYDAVYLDENTGNITCCKLEQIPDTDFYAVTASEQTDNAELPEGISYKIDGYNYATQYIGDLVTLKKATVSKSTAKKNRLTVTWKAVSGAKGYEVRYSTSSKMTNAWTQTLSSSKKSVTISNLKSKVKVYVQVRAYKTDSNGNKITGAWSKAVSVKTK